MKMRILAACAALLAGMLPLAGQTGAPGSSPDIDGMVSRIQEKLRAGKKTPAELAPELADFDTLREKYAESDPAKAAKVAQLQYTLLRDVLKDASGAAKIRAELTTKYRKHLGPDSRVAQEIAMEEEMAKVKETQQKLVGQPAPELNFVWSSEPKLKKLSDLKGKVVVIDFWATWCGPCITTFPQIRELTAHYKEADVVVLGVTSVQGSVMGLEPARIDTRNDPEREFALTADFIKAKEMTWPVVFSEQRVFNPDYGVRGIPHMAIIAPDGTVRHNGLHPSLPHAEKVEKIDAILKEFGKPTAGRAAGE